MPDDTAQAGDLGPCPGLFGRGLARLYALAIARRNRVFDRGRGVTRFDRPVISVGNLSVGGTGKTPMVMHVLAVLQGAGLRACVAMRGYKAESGEQSDEERLYRDLGVPVVARPDRAVGLRELLKREPIDVIVLDDGFQHRRIARDLDIVLLDASRDPFHDRLLPAGWLREPVSSLARAHAVVLTHAEMVTPRIVQEIDEKVRGVTGRDVQGVARHAWSGVRVDHKGWAQTHPASWLAGKRTVVVSAIGHPGAFEAGARRAGCEVLAMVALPDHDAYGPRSMARIRDALVRYAPEIVLTTQKDWTKLEKHAGALELPVARPVLELVFDRGQDALDRLILGRAKPVQ